MDFTPRQEAFLFAIQALRNKWQENAADTLLWALIEHGELPVPTPETNWWKGNSNE